MVKVKIFVIPHMYGATANLTVAVRNSGTGGKVRLSRNIGLAIDDDVRLFAQVAGAMDIPVFDLNGARTAAVGRVLSQMGAAWDVGNSALDLDGLHVWEPRLGWVDLGAGAQKLFAFPLLDRRGGVTSPYFDQHKVKDAAGVDQTLQLDFLVAVQQV